MLELGLLKFGAEGERVAWEEKLVDEVIWLVGSYIEGLWFRLL